MRAFFLRRLLAAALLDEQISEQEQAVIGQASAAFSCDAQRVADLVAWMKVGIEAERRLDELLAGM